ncbi:MAG: lipid A biosynthesis acyltransferase [Deltaproteobacteria bacterium]|nr:lipid A biosynthesis acyltransferase [Deltaproteobacteria bacterium]
MNSSQMTQNQQQPNVVTNNDGNAKKQNGSSIIQLPAHWGHWQRLKNGFIFLFVRLSLALFTHLPFVMLKLFTLTLGCLAPYVAPLERHRALKHLELAMPKLSAKERRSIMRRMFLHLALSAAETVHIDRFISGTNAVQLSPEHREVLDTALSEGRGVIIITGHIGNWELLAQVVAHAGYHVASIAKPTYDPRLTKLVQQARCRYGMQMIWRGDADVGKKMLGTLRKGGLLALLIDQDTKVPGDFVPFFGRPAYTPTTAASLSLKLSTPVIITWDHRVNNKHVLHFARLPFTKSGNHDENIIRLTAAITAELETAIRQHPEQWVWMHQRWRRQPKDS